MLRKKSPQTGRPQVKRGIGRPPKRDAQTAVLTVKVSQSWPDKLKRIAARRGVTLGEIVKSAIEAAYPELTRAEDSRANWTPGGAA